MSRCLLLGRGMFAVLSFLLGVFFQGDFFSCTIAVNLRAAEVTTGNLQPDKTVFRRLFVPVDAPETWPVGPERFLPIPRAEFSRLIDQSETKSPSKKHLPVHVSKAIYRAKLLPNNVLAGTTEWTVEVPGEQSRLLPLSPLNVAIQSASWRREPTKRASVGLWKRSGNSSRHTLELAVLAEQSGILQMQWQLAAQKVDSTGTVYILKKPIVVPQTLELDLPANYSAVLSHAELLRSDSGPLGESRWVFQLAPQEIHQIRIVRQTPAKSTQIMPLVSQTTSYQLDLSGLHVFTQLRLDARESQITELKATLTGRLRVVEVLVDQQPATWRVVDNAGEKGGENLGATTLVIPRPDSQHPQSVEIRCLAKFRPDIRWELPKLRFDGVAWTEGTTSLLVSPDLDLRSLTPRQATLQHIVGIADRAREGEVFRLQEWSREAKIEVEIGRLRPRLAAQTLTTIDLGRDEAHASIVAEMSNTGGDLYQVQAFVAAGWAIDSVTATPKSALKDWHLDQESSTPTLYVQLNQPISEQQPLPIEIEASETSGKPVLPATVGQLKLLRFLKTETSHEWLQLRTRESKQLALADRLEQARFAQDELPLGLLDSDSSVGTLLEVSQLDEAEVLEFRQQLAQYEANLQIEVEALPDALNQRYQIDCQVRSGAVSVVTLEFDRPLSETVQWTFAGLRTGQRGIATMERVGANGGKPTYVLRLPVAMTDDFRLHASYSQPAQTLERCNLIRLPNSLDWNGHVFLRGSLVGFKVLDQGWTPTVSSTIQSADKTNGKRLPLLGTYRIGPEEFRRGSTSAGLRLLRQPKAPPTPQLIAWMAEYHTLQAADGAAIHTAHFSLENLGIDEAKLVLPPGAELQEAWLNEQQLELKLFASEGNTYQFRLNKDQRWPYLAIKYSSHEPPLEGSATLRPAVPECSFPVNLGRWTLWAPEQYEIDDTQKINSSQQSHWWKRLFGPLARSREETVFNPTSSTGWKQLWTVPKLGQATKQATDKQVIQPVNRLGTNQTHSVNDSRWHRATPVKNPQWNSPLATTLTHVGQRAQTVDFMEGLPTLTVRRAYVHQALWHALLLLTVVLGVWQLAHYPNITILAGAIAGAACLTVPVQWLTFPQAVFLGLIAAAIVRVAMKSSQFWDDRSTSLRKVGQATALILLVCLQNLTVQAQSPATSANEKNIPRILVPVNAQGQRQGEDVYLSEEFLNKLQQAPQKLANDGAELVFLAASYSGSLPNKIVGTATTNKPNATDPWTLLWKVENYVPNARLFLPLLRDEALWNSGSHRLDGVPVKLEWQPDGKGCSVILPETGIHKLLLVVQPYFQSNDRSVVLRLHVPPLSGAAIDLTLAPNVDDLQVSGTSRDKSSDGLDSWHGLLGPNEVLELRWNSKAVTNNGASWGRLEQSAWLHVDPATARLDVQLSITGYQSDSQLLELEVSPQLKLEPPEADSPIVEVIMPSASQPTRLQLKLRRGLPAELVIPLRFELQRAGSIGRLFFPRVRLQGSPPAQNLFAVSVSAGLSYDERVSNDLRSIEPTEFSRSWISSAELPLYAYALGPEDPEWSLRVWPDPQSLTAQQSLRVYCLPNGARVDFEAAVDELTGVWLSHRLEVPESLEIDAITVRDSLRGTAESNSVPVRWSRVSETEAVVFLGRPLRHAHRLQLKGHVHATQGNEMKLPQIRLLHGERSEIHMDLYRTVEVQVSWADPKRAPQEIPGQKIARSSEEIHVGHFSWRSSQAGVLSTLRLERNDQTFETATVTTVHSGADGWTARLNSRLFVRQGVVSRLRLSVPDSFQGPFELLPEEVGVIDEVRETPVGKAVTVLLTQPATAGDQVEIRLGGRLNLPADQRLVIPSLLWDGANRRERYVLLPTFVDGQSLQWQTTAGLRRQALPLQLAAYAPEGVAAHSYRLEQSHFEAKERTYRGALRNAAIRHAKVAGILDAEGTLTATAEFVFQPGRASSCAIQLPPESQLHQLVVGDRPVRRDLRDDGSWKVPVGPPFMPQRIVVSYRTKLGSTARRLQLVSPKILLGDQTLPAPKTWWRIRTPLTLQLSKPIVGRRTSEVQFVKNSYLQPQLVLQDALSQALNLPREEGRAWAHVWQTIIRQAEQEWQAIELQESDRLDLSTAEEKLTEFSATFSEAFASNDTTAMNLLSPPIYPPKLPSNLGTSPEYNEHFLVSDSQGQLVLTVSQGIQQSLWRVFAAFALVCGTLAVVLQLRRFPNWYHELCHWPHSLALAGGIVWWLLLEPSAIGMLVIVLALTSLALKRWRWLRQQRRQKPNTQLAVPAS